MTEQLFDGYPDPEPPASPPEGLGKDAQRTWRRRQMLAQGIHPATNVRVIGTAENGLTCADCQFLLRKRMRSFKGWKCELAASGGKDGPDMVKSWPACEQFRGETS